MDAVHEETIRADLKESEQEMRIYFTRIHSKSTSSNKINILRDLVKDLEANAFSFCR